MFVGVIFVSYRQNAIDSTANGNVTLSCKHGSITECKIFKTIRKVRSLCKAFAMFFYVPGYFCYGSIRQHWECILSQPPLCNACHFRSLTTALHRGKPSRRELI